MKNFSSTVAFYLQNKPNYCCPLNLIKHSQFIINWILFSWDKYWSRISESRITKGGTPLSILLSRARRCERQ